MQNALCDVVLISGFLGAGKTTLLRHILNWEGSLSGTAILVNEFGAVGIDGDLLQDFDAPVVEMANGCICCTLQADFHRSVQDIIDRFQPSRLLIEATGVADPHDILTALQAPQFRQKLDRAKTVSVVDADFWEARENFGPLFSNQIKAGELILLNKVDLHPPEMISQFLEEIQEMCPSSSILPTYHCRIDPDALWGIQSQLQHRLSASLPMFVEDAPGGAHDRQQVESNAPKLGYVSFSFESTTPFREECFRQFLASVPANLYRIKGYVCVEDRYAFINHVGGKTEWVDSDAREQSRLAFVGWQVEEQLLIARLRECLDR